VYDSDVLHLKEETGVIARFRGIEPSGLDTGLAWELDTELDTEPTNTNIEPELPGK
jgi:hypothetical protein